MTERTVRQWIGVTVILMTGGMGCAFGPRAIEKTHGLYGSAVDRVAEEQLLRNIVRLRYTESPAELDISAIAAQYELEAAGEVRPFFSSEGVNGPFFQSFSTILPFASVSGANRPTVSMVPQSDASSVRQFLTPITFDSLVFLTQAGWSVEHIFRIWVDRLNGVPNRVAAAGPPRNIPTDFARFLRATELLQEMQDRELISVRTEDRMIPRSGSLPVDAVTSAAVVAAAKEGFEFQPTGDGTWSLNKKESRLVLVVNPMGKGTPELAELAAVLNLRPGSSAYEIEIVAGVSDPARNPIPPATALRVTPRSTAQALFFLANGVEVPPAHLACGLVSYPLDGSDPTEATRNLFVVHSVPGKRFQPPACAYLAIWYRDHWFYIDDRDHESKATLFLMLQLRRLDFQRQEIGGIPALTLPVGR